MSSLKKSILGKSLKANLWFSRCHFGRGLLLWCGSEATSLGGASAGNGAPGVRARLAQEELPAQQLALSCLDFSSSNWTENCFPDFCSCPVISGAHITACSAFKVTSICISPKSYQIYLQNYFMASLFITPSQSPMVLYHNNKCICHPILKKYINVSTGIMSS